MSKFYAKQLIDLVETSTVTSGWGDRTTTYDYNDRRKVKQGVNNATVSELRKATSHLGLKPADAPPFYNEDWCLREWKVGSKDELTRRVFLAWLDRFSEAEKAAIRAKGKREAAHRYEEEASDLLDKADKLLAEADELDKIVEQAEGE